MRIHYFQDGDDDRMSSVVVVGAAAAVVVVVGIVVVDLVRESGRWDIGAGSMLKRMIRDGLQTSAIAGDIAPLEPARAGQTDE